MRNWIFIALLLTGCGAEPYSELKRGPNEGNTLFVVMGGNKSCSSYQDHKHDPRGMASWAFIKSIVQKYQERQKPLHYLTSCFVSNTPKVKLLSSESPDTLDEVSVTDHLAELATRIEATMGQHYLTNLVVVGYSFGGWLSMNTVAKLGIPVTAYITIDPISRDRCRTWKPLGCQEAPKLTDRDRSRIADLTGYWLNYYQRNTWYLRSSRIPEADRNVQLEEDHYSIEVEPSVWDAIQKFLEESVERA